jgi:3',5'-cyclic AMP phosphodiesterase CpdA
MKIWLLSDLHIDIHPYQPIETDADVLVLAGDIAEGTLGAKWARNEFQHIPTVIYVPGNHEYYGSSIQQIDQELHALQTQQFHVLQCGELTIGQTRFLGCSLWTDFCLYGSEQQEIAMFAAQNGLADYRWIGSGSRLAPKQRLTPSDTTVIYQQHRNWLRQKLLEPFSGTTVVITHHAPDCKSIHHRFTGSPLSPAFASDASELVLMSNYWLHGHTHDSSDYYVGHARVLCNPRGYATETHIENAEFNDQLLLKV